jgi:hypothetical protein
MFGLLGGLLGGAMRGGMMRPRGGGGALGGLLGNRGGKSGGGGMQRSQAPEPSKDAPMQAEPQEQSGQTKPQEQQPQAPQQPPTQAPVEMQSSQIELPKTQQQATQKSPLSGLADDPAAAPTPAKRAGEPVPEPAQIVNKTATPTPTARPMDEQLGAVPVMQAQDGVQNQLMDSGSNRQLFEFQEGNPSRQPNLPNQSYSADQGFRFVGPTTVELPSRQYRSRV